MDLENIPSSNSETVQEALSKVGQIRQKLLEEIAANLALGYLKEARAGRVFCDSKMANVKIPWRYSSMDVEACGDILVRKGWNLVGLVNDGPLFGLGRRTIAINPCTPREKHHNWGGPY